MISIGAVIGGPECAFMDKYVRLLMGFFIDNRSVDTSSAEVNIVFHLPGSIIKPDYVGLRTGTFSKKRKKLMVQAAVEDEFIRSTSSEEVINYLVEVSDEAIGIAKNFFDRKNMDYDLESDRKLLNEWKESVE